MEKKRHNFIRFLAYVRPYTWYVVVGAIGGMFKFTVPLLVPLVTRHLLDNVFLDESLSPAEKLHDLYLAVGAMGAVFVVVYAPAVFIRHYHTSKAGHRSVFDLRCHLYYRILRMSTSFFGRNKSGEIVSRLISDIQMTQNLVGSALTNIWMDTAALIVILALLLNIDVGITLSALVTFPLYIYSFRRLQGKIRTASYQVQEEIANLSGNVNEKIAGNVVVHAFTQEHREQSQFNLDSERIFFQAMRTQYLQSVNMVITGTLTGIAPLIVLLYGGWLVVQGEQTVGDLVAVTMLLGPLYLPLQRFSELNVVYANSMAALDRIFEVMDQQPEIRDRHDAIDLDRVEGAVTFDQVHFGYEPGKPVLRDVSFDVKPGEKVALVGPSGSGKSTILSLVPRFYDVQDGSVRIDGHDVRGLKIRTLRTSIGMVLQDPILFSGTIEDNIRYGNPEAPKQALVEACIAANAHDFIQSLPMGLQTEVGERGNFLSGGQRQRITIARAFLKNPAILLLDEPTSALDAESEVLIQEALQRLMKGKTTFIIAHRLSTIIHADTILVMHDGVITESGKHGTLIRDGGLYRSLYEQQFRFVHETMAAMPCED